MATKKKTNTHNSTAKKRSASLASSKRAAKKTAVKRSQSVTKANTKSRKNPKNPKPGKMSRKTEEMTLKMFQMVYEDYQKGKFHPIFHDSPR
jgi:hypothetical protein